MLLRDFSHLKFGDSLACLVLKDVFLGSDMTKALCGLKKLVFLGLEGCRSQSYYDSPFLGCENIQELHLIFSQNEKREMIILENLPKSLIKLTVEGIFASTKYMEIGTLNCEKFRHLKVWQTSYKEKSNLAIEFKTRPGSPLDKFETNCRLTQFFDLKTIFTVKNLTIGCKTSEIFTYKTQEGPHVTHCLKFSEFTCLEYLSIPTVPDRFCCEFPSGNGATTRTIHIELGTGHPSVQTRQHKLDPEKTTKLLIEQPTIEIPTQTELTPSIISSNLQELLNDYSKALQQLYDESNNLKGQLSNYSAATQRKINELNYLSVLLNYSEIQQRLNNMNDKTNVLNVSYSELFQLISFKSETTWGMHFKRYSKAIKQLTNKSNNLKALLSNCSAATTQQPINPNDSLQILLDVSLTFIIQLVDRFDSWERIVCDHSNANRQPRYFQDIEMALKSTNDILPLLSSLNKRYSEANHEIQCFQSTIQQQIEMFNSAPRSQ